MNSNIANKLFRKKLIVEAESSDLNRCLSTFDLVTMGVGSTLGAGAYVLTGSVARDDAGPAIIVSFAIAAFCSLLAGLCYAEFGARVPKAGSAYIYSYVTVGEIPAFIIGWNLILEYIIGVSSVARAWSANLDSLTGGKIADAMRHAMPMNVNGFASYPDFLSVGIIALITVMLSIGMNFSSKFMTVLTAVNVLVLAFCSVLGFTKADVGNWSLNTTDMEAVCFNGSTPAPPDDGGSGHFLPYGFSRMLEGAASCFYAFVGFDVIACVGEEAKNPSKAIPRSIVWTLVVCFVAYAAVSSALTLMQPFCSIDVDAPLPAAFSYVGLSWASTVIAVGSMMALSASLLGAAVGMPRIVFSMARDGLIFKWMAKLSSSGTPVVATVISGVFSALMSLVFDLNDLVNMMSIGTLMAYTLVAASVLILRYTPAPEDANEDSYVDGDDDGLVAQLRRKRGWDTPVNNISRGRVVYYTFFTVILLFVLSLILVLCPPCMTAWWGYTIIAILLLFVFAGVLIVAVQPQSKAKLLFRTPFVPLLPFLSVFVNIYLMLKLPSETWLRFAIWMVLGTAIYFGYGYKSSVEGVTNDSVVQNSDYERFENEEYTPPDGKSNTQTLNLPATYGSTDDLAKTKTS